MKRGVRLLLVVTAGVVAAAIALLIATDHKEQSPQRYGFVGLGPFLPGSGASGGGGVTTVSGGTAASGMAFTGASIGGSTITFTSSTPIVNNYAGTVLQWNTEGECSTAANNSTCSSWIMNASGTGAAQSTTTGAATTAARPFWFRWTSGTATNSRLSFQTTPTALLGGGAWSFHMVVGAEQLSNATDEYAMLVGFIDNVTQVNQTDGVFFLYDRANGASGGNNAGNANKWECCGAVNGTQTCYLMDGTTVSDGSFTTVDQAVAAFAMPSTNLYNLDIEVNAGATQADFYVNGTKSCTLTTAHIPSAASRALGHGFLTMNSAGTGSGRVFDFDAIYVTHTLTSARTP